MNQIDIEPWKEIIKNVQKPLQAIYELNLHAVKEIKFLQISDLTQSKSPLELVEKQVAYSMENLHHAIDYTKQMSEILRQSMHPLTESMKETTKTTLHRATSLLEPTSHRSVARAATEMFSPPKAKTPSGVANEKNSQVQKVVKEAGKNAKKINANLMGKKQISAQKKVTTEKNLNLKNLNKSKSLK